MSITNTFRQIGAVSRLNIANLPKRWVTSLVAIVGIAGVVMVTVGLLSVAEGFRSAMQDKSRPDVVIILRSSATGELDSGFRTEDMQAMEMAPGLARDGNSPMLSPELFAVVDVPRKSTGTSSNVPLRGVRQAAFDVRGNVNIVAGRMFTPGLNEVVVGQGARAIFTGLELGTVLKWGSNNWTVVGLMSAGGGVPDSEIWADLGVVQNSYRRGNFFSTIRARLTDPAQLATFKDTLTSDPRLNVSVKTESEFYSEQSQFFTIFVRYIGFLVGALMGLGAIFGAINTMYNAVSSRIREIATLRALGFGAFPVVVSVLLEALFLGLIGGLIGAAAAFVIFNGLQVATLNWNSFSQVSFGFAVTPGLLRAGIVFALIMGLLGGILPGIRAARIPITTALREL